MLSKGRAKEGQNIFGGGSMTGIVITILVKNPHATEQGKVYYADIGDDLKQKEKLEKLNTIKSISDITAKNSWQIITPDVHNDWINQRDNSLSDFIKMGDKKDKNAAILFSLYSMGIKTNRDEWVYNFSQKALQITVEKMLTFYNQQVDEVSKNTNVDIDSLISRDKSKIKWTTDILSDLAKGKKHRICLNDVVLSLYRPFTKQWVYANKNWNWTRHLMPQIFPNSLVENRVICVCGVGARSGFSVLMANQLSDLQLEDNGQCFPLYLYEANNDTPEQPNQNELFVQDSDVPIAKQIKYTRRDAVTNDGLNHFLTAYPNQTITKEDVFYYIYGLLHSQDYKTKYADNLTKELPRIPCVKQTADFWAFSKAGRNLAELHINYETVTPYPVTFDVPLDTLSPENFYVKQMKFAKKGDKTIVIYNAKITMKDIPVEAYDYVVNGKPALEWVMERQAVTTHKDSGIVNDANDWAIETMGNARYPLELFQRVITVSLETMKIVRSLPKLEV
jgi:predicted helicase